jgi:hypothetical protein
MAQRINKEIKDSRRGNMENMERYIDGFLIPIHKNKVNAYKQMAQKTGEIW